MTFFDEGRSRVNSYNAIHAINNFDQTRGDYAICLQPKIPFWLEKTFSFKIYLCLELDEKKEKEKESCELMKSSKHDVYNYLSFFSPTLTYTHRNWHIEPSFLSWRLQKTAALRKRLLLIYKTQKLLWIIKKQSMKKPKPRAKPCHAMVCFLRASLK